MTGADGEEGGEKVDLFDLTATVHLSGADEAAKTAAALAEKINEAKTLASELTSLIEKLEVKFKRS